MIYRILFPKGEAALKTRLVLAIYFLLTVLSLTVCAYEGEYNIKLSSGMSLFSADSDEWITADEKTLERLLAHGMVEHYEENFVMELYEYAENDPLYNTMWEHELMNSENAWEYGAFGADVTVGIIDSGANAHTELSGRIKYAHSYVNNNSADVTDPIGHGTAVAGIVAANRGNGNGFTGVSPRVQLAVLQVVTLDAYGNQVGLTVSMVADAIDDAVELYGCDVINLSLGASKTSLRIEEAVANALSHGAVVVAAAGNGGGTAHSYPASYEEVISVASVGSKGVVASTSRHNSGVNIAAPGASVNTITGTDGYTTKSGTSFACPQITGICAAMRSANPTLTWRNVFDIITSCAKDAGAAGRDDYYGSGIVDFGACIKNAVGNCGIYMSKIDKEDPDARMYIVNTGDAEGGYRMYLKANEYDMSSVILRLSAGENTVVPMSKYLTDGKACPFAVPLLSHYAVSRRADSMGIAPAEEVPSFSISVEENDGKLAINGGEVSIGQNRMCNVTVTVGQTSVYAAQHTATDGKINLSLDIPVDDTSLDGYSASGVPVNVTLWGSAEYGAKASAVSVLIKDEGASAPSVNADDLVLLRKVVAGLAERDSVAVWDYDSDGECTADDIVILRKKIAGLA